MLNPYRVAFVEAEPVTLGCDITCQEMAGVYYPSPEPGESAWREPGEAIADARLWAGFNRSVARRHCGSAIGSAAMMGDRRAVREMIRYGETLVGARGAGSGERGAL